MSNKRVAFLQGDVTRALKGARAAGFEPASFKIAPDGSIMVSNQPLLDVAPSDDTDQWEAEYRARQA